MRKFVRYLGGMPIVSEEGYLDPGVHYEVLEEKEVIGEVHYRLLGLKGLYKQQWFGPVEKQSLPVHFALTDVMPKIGQEMVCILVGKNLKPWYTEPVQKISEPSMGVYQVETCEGIYLVRVKEHI